MPSARYVSGSRGQEGCFSCRISTTHCLLLGSETDSTPINLSKFLPSSVDVVLLENLSITLSVYVNGVQWSNQTVRTSIIAQHLVHFLRKNASFMAVSHVSDAYLDDEDGDAVKVTIIPKYRVVEFPPSAPLATLQSIRLVYRIKSGEDKGADKTSFSFRILNELVNRFVTFQLIRRYPLIFGHKRLHPERQLFPSVARSLVTMSERSPNAYFQQQVRRHLKLLKKRLKAIDYRAREELRYQCGVEDDDLPLHVGHSHENETSMEDVLSSAMQRLYKMAIRSSSFKGQDVQEDELNLNGLNDQERDSARIQCLSQQEPRHGAQSAVEALLDTVNSSDDLNIYRSEGGSSESDWERTEWPALPSPPSSLPVGEPDPFVPCAPMKDGQTIACDDVMMPDDFANSHASYSQPSSSLASLQRCDSDKDHSALQADFDYSSGDSAFVYEEIGSYEEQGLHRTHVPSDFDFSEDDEPPASLASQGPRRVGGLLDFRYEEAIVAVPATTDDEFDTNARFNSGLDELPIDNTDFPFERERRLAGHEAPSRKTSVTHVMASFDEVLASGGVLTKDSPLSGSQNSGHWHATFPLQPSMSPPSARYFERSQSVDVGLDLTRDIEDEFVVREWDLTTSRGSPPASGDRVADMDIVDALDDSVARREQHCELDFNQRSSVAGYSPDRLENEDWDDVEEEEAFRITDVDMEIGGDKSTTFRWSREEDLELELEY